LLSRTTRRIPPVVGAAALAAAFTVAPLAHAEQAERIVVPAVPDGLGVDAPNKPFFVGHAVGTQNYVCLPSGAGFAWSLFTPEATLFNDRLKHVITHFFSLNPDEAGTPIRATWQHSRDASTVWAATVPGGASTDPRFVAVGAVPWLKLEMKGVRGGPTADEAHPGILTVTTFIQRLNTAGGVAPATGCAQLSDVG